MCTDDITKLQFALDAVLKPDPFGAETTIDSDIYDAIEWHAQRSPDQVIREREAVLRRIEERAEWLWHE